ncbi:MAG: hypothetical protein KAS12_04555 [Candidatus Aenigmarchaeota archaeon]|nr:hypothetical protein [Candidatus Aenigmarchaeota archaeon]
MNKVQFWQQIGKFIACSCFTVVLVSGWSWVYIYVRNWARCINEDDEYFKIYTALSVLIADFIIHFIPTMQYVLLTKKVKKLALMINIIIYIVALLISGIGYSFVDGGRSTYLYIVQFVFFVIAYITSGLMLFQKNIRLLVATLIPAVLALIVLVICDYSIYSLYMDKHDNLAVNIFIKVILYPMIWHIIIIISRFCLLYAFKNMEIERCYIIMIPALFAINYFNYVITLQIKNIFFMILAIMASTILRLIVKIVVRNKEHINKLLPHCITRVNDVVVVKTAVCEIESKSDTVPIKIQIVIQKDKIIEKTKSFLIGKILGFSNKDNFYAIYLTLDHMINIFSLLIVINDYIASYVLNIENVRDIHEMDNFILNAVICLSLEITFILLFLKIDHFYGIKPHFIKFSILEWCFIIYFILAIVCNCTWRIVWFVNPQLYYWG